MLNHTLKNIMANSAGEIEGFLEEHYGESLPVECSCLRRSLACLQRGMRWCKNRQAYLDLVAGDYVSNCEATCLRTFKEAVTAGRQLSVACADECVMLDTRLCDLILDNALSNAFQHGDLENPNVHLAITVTDAGLDASPGKKTVSFRVTNRARPGRPPLTEAFVAELLRGGRPTRRTNPMSDGIGFRHLMMAGRAHGMELSLWQELDLVTFEAQVAVDAADRTAVAGSHIVSEELVRQFPSGLNIYYIDDSLLAQQLVEHNLRRCAQPNCVKTFGKEPADARPFVSAVLEDAHIAILDQNLDWPGECLQVIPKTAQWNLNIGQWRCGGAGASQLRKVNATIYGLPHWGGQEGAGFFSPHLSCRIGARPRA